MLKFLLNELITRNLDKALNYKFGRNRRSLLHIAIAYSLNEEAEKLIEKGLDINVQDVNGSTPLHLAVLGTNRGGIKLLLDKGANINIPNKRNKIPNDYSKYHLGEGLDERIKPKAAQ